MARWGDKDKPYRPLSFGAGILLILGLAFAAAAPFAGANNPPPPNPNDVAYWCPNGGVKYDPASTPFTVPDPPVDRTWTLLVLKAGAEQSADPVNEQFANPIPGQAYSRTDGKDISHAILCQSTLATTTTATTVGDDPPTTTSTTTSTTTTLPTTTTAPQCPEEPCVPDTQATTTTTVATTTTRPPGTPGTFCVGLCAGQFDTTTTTAPTTTVASTTTTAAPSTTVAPTTAPPTTAATTTAPAPVPAPELPVTGGNPWWLALFGACLVALGLLAVAWVRVG